MSWGLLADKTKYKYIISHALVDPLQSEMQHCLLRHPARSQLYKYYMKCCINIHLLPEFC